MQSTNFVATNTPINGTSVITAESVSTDLLNLIADYNQTIGFSKIDTTAVTQVLQTVYPVGSIYINSSNSANPVALFGFGTWVAIGSGQVLVGVNVSDTNFATVGQTGGNDSANLSHSHGGLTHSHGLGGHYHGVNINGQTTTVNQYLTGNELPFGSSLQRNHNHSFTTSGNTGGPSGGSDNSSPTTDNQLSATQSLLQPYITVYMWTRTS